MKLLIRPLADHAIELNIRCVKLRLSGFQYSVEAVDQASHLVAIQIAVVVVKIVQIGLLVVLRFVVATLDSPNVSPVRRRGMVGAKQIV